jgi:Uncharacterized protein conserved in bacteria
MSDVLRSEWTKLRSVRSTVWLLGGTLLLTVGLGVLLPVIGSNVGRLASDPVTLSLSGTTFASLLTAVLGVLVMSSEYRTGMIRTTLLAVPRRGRVLAAKAIVLTVVVLVLTLGALLPTFLVGQAILGERGVGLGEPEVLRAVVGAALYLAACALFGLGLGALIRHTAGGVVAVFMLLVLLPQMANLLPDGWGEQVYRFFTSNAGQQVLLRKPAPGLLEPWAGFGVFCAWVAVALAAAAVLLHRRDA